MNKNISMKSILTFIYLLFLTQLRREGFQIMGY